MTVTRMDLADFGSLDDIAVEIFRLEPDLPVPVPVEDLARQLDVSDIKTLETQGFEGGLVTDAEKSRGVILVNTSSRVERRRFSVGHELGHFLSPWHKPLRSEGFLCTADDMRMDWASKQNRAAEMEVEANRFSAQILMPRTRFRLDMRRRQGCDLEHVLALARDYVTSKEATARRYIDLHDEPCAAVVSQNGVVLRVYRNEDFPYVDVRKGLPVPPGSITSDKNIAPGAPTDTEEIDGSTWLPSTRGRRCPMLYEQVLVQQDGFRMTLLSLAEDDEAD